MNTANDYVNVTINTLPGQSYQYQFDKIAKCIEVYYRYYQETRKHPRSVKFVHKNKCFSYFSMLSEYVGIAEGTGEDENSIVLFATDRLGHWSQTAKEYPELHQIAINITASNPEIAIDYVFIALFKRTIDKAIESM